jgi:hypothetical protein
MAVLVKAEKEQGAKESPSIPVFVYDNTGAALSYADAVTALDAAAGGEVPVLFDGLPHDGNPGQRRLSKSAWQFTINYRATGSRPSKPPAVGDDPRAGFNWRLGRKWVQFAPEVDRFFVTGDDPGPSQNVVHQVVDANGFPTNSGIWLDPPDVNLSQSLSVDPADVTGSWVRSIASLRGMVNSVALTSGAYAAGEILLVSVVGSLVSADAFTIDVGWNWTENVTGEERGLEAGDIVADYNGQDYVWDLLAPYTDRDGNRIAWKVRGSYVHRVRKYGDLSALGIEPP